MRSLRSRQTLSTGLNGYSPMNCGAGENRLFETACQLRAVRKPYIGLKPHPGYLPADRISIRRGDKVGKRVTQPKPSNCSVSFDISLSPTSDPCVPPPSDTRS